MGLAQAADVVLWHSMRGAEADALEAAAHMAATAQGDAVSVVGIPFGAFDTKLETAIPHGNGPDVFIAGHGGLGAWRELGLVAPVVDLDLAFWPVAADAVSLDGRAYGQPLSLKSLVLVYDPTQVESPPQTLDALAAYGDARAAKGELAFAWMVAEPYFLAPYVHALGGAFVGADRALESDAQRAALAIAQRFGRHPAMPAQPTSDVVRNGFASGDIPIVFSGPWFAAEVTRPLAAVPLPAVSSDLPARPFLTVDAAFVSAHARSPGAAHALARALAGVEAARRLAEEGGVAPARRDVDAVAPLAKAVVASIDGLVPMPTDPGLSSAFEAHARALRDVLRGGDPASAAAGAQRTFDVLTRPIPPAVASWPYVLALALAAVAALGAGFGHLWTQRKRLSSGDWLWVAPGAGATALLVGIPFLWGASRALYERVGDGWRFVGLAHFGDILLGGHGPLWAPMSFWYALAVTVVWTAANLALHVGIGLGLAVALNAPWIWGRTAFRAILILPWAVPSYLTALVWKGMFHSQMGAINALLAIGIGRDVDIDWTGSFLAAFTANLTTNTWLGFPFMMVVALGALASVPKDLVDAATVDGATGWQRFRHVVWPTLLPAMIPAILLGSVWTFNAFNVVMLVSGGEPNGATELLVTESWRWAFSRGHRTGYAAAYALLVMVVLLAWSRVTTRMGAR